jgi:hypothetical protein
MGVGEESREARSEARSEARVQSRRGEESKYLRESEKNVR